MIMNTGSINNLGGIFPILTATLMLLFWTLFAVLLPMTEPYINWVQNQYWVSINSIGFAGSLFGLFALLAIFSHIQTKGILEYIGLGVGIAGIAVMTSLLFFEAFILKGIAQEQPELIVLNSGFYLFPPFKIMSLVGGICFSSGIIILGIKMIKVNTFKKWKIIILIIGCPLFVIVAVPGIIRLLGVFLYVVAFLFIGIEILKRKDANLN